MAEPEAAPPALKSRASIERDFLHGHRGRGVSDPSTNEAARPQTIQPPFNEASLKARRTQNRKANSCEEY
jgi:hypothetical protein